MNSIEFTETTPNQTTDTPKNLLDKRIEYQGATGTIKYAGTLKHDANKKDSNQIWLGLQWDNPTRGKHNGTVDGYEYFKCDDGMNSGSLLKLDRANLGINIYDGIHVRYFATPAQSSDSSHHETFTDAKGVTIERDDEVYFETVKKFKKKVEFIGFDKIWKKLNDLKNLHELSLPHCNISDIGPDGSLRALLPNLRNLSLESNLLCDWNQVYLIGRELKNLQELSISGNRLKEPEDIKTLNQIYINSNDTVINEAPLNLFSNLKNIVLISMNLTWKTLNKVLSAFVNVQSLVLCYNELNDSENLTLTGADFKKLEFLNLEGNNLKSLDTLMKFKDAPQLSRLILSKNELNDFSTISGFDHVKSIIMEENNIKNFSVFSQLNRFPRLEILRITKNPIYTKTNQLHVRQRAIAEVRNLKNINGSELKKYERKDCEIYYLRNTFHDYFEKTGESGDEYDYDKFKEFCEREHPRIPELTKMFGNPYDEGIKNKAKSEAPKPKVASLIPLKLSAFSGPHLGKPEIKKKFTDNTLITNLKAMLAKQFGIPANKQKIYFKSDPKDPFIVMDEDLKDLKFYGVKEGHEIWVGDTEL